MCTRAKRPEAGKLGLAAFLRPTASLLHAATRSKPLTPIVWKDISLAQNILTKTKRVIRLDMIESDKTKGHGVGGWRPPAHIDPPYPDLFAILTRCSTRNSRTKNSPSKRCLA